ncbi:MAG TPA: sigma-70 family RNA polymerase sigma factor [Sunxiuqinia sp.]|nr:sigma-70 family RNA polymerase sigma factor [Sunxiuqinia sp.]
MKKTSRIEYREALPELPEKSSVLDEIVANESLQILLNAIHQLDEIDKSIMLLYLEEKSYDEIAEIIGLSKSNVGVRINRAKKQLKQHLKDQDYGK